MTREEMYARNDAIWRKRQAGWTYAGIAREAGMCTSSITRICLIADAGQGNYERGLLLMRIERRREDIKEYRELGRDPWLTWADKLEEKNRIEMIEQAILS